MSGKFPLLRAYARRVKEIFWEWQGVKSAGEAVSDHASTEKKAKVLVSMSIIAIFTCLVTLQIKGCYDESEIRAADQTARSYQSQLSEADRNMREKDGQILRQQIENGNLKSQLAQWQTMPQNVTVLYSNLHDLYLESSDPENRKQLGLILDQIRSMTTNFVKNSELDKPKLEITIDGIQVQDQAKIPITSGQLKVRIINAGSVMAESYHLTFTIPRTMTNLIGCSWDSSEPPFKIENGHTVEMENVATWTLNKTDLMPGVFDSIEGINISTNADDFVCPLRIALSEKKSGKQEFHINLLFKKK